MAVTSARFRFLGGTFAGISADVAKPYYLIGRHPHADLRFEFVADLPVSIRHAAIVRRDGIFFLRDLGSTNGTYLNGRRVWGDQVLADHDRVQFGAQGPEVEFRLLAATEPVSATPVVCVAPSTAPVAERRTMRPTPVMVPALPADALRVAAPPARPVPTLPPRPVAPRSVSAKPSLLRRLVAAIGATVLAGLIADPGAARPADARPAPTATELSPRPGQPPR